MSIRQLSVSLANVPGALATISELLGREGVNIRAISVADTSDISTVRFVVDDHGKAKGILTDGGYDPKEIDVLALEMKDHPGSVSAVLDGNAIVILGVDRTEEAQQVLADNWVTTLGAEVYNH